MSAPWESIVSRKVSRLIVEANGGKWPALVSEWEAVLRRFGLTCDWVPGLPVAASCIVGHFAFFPLPDGDTDTSAVEAYLHEAAEGCLCWEGTSPYCYPAEDAEDARHRIACRVRPLATI